MTGKLLAISSLLLLAACGKGTGITRPTYEAISESIYASGIVKSDNQYQAYATVSGIVSNVFLTEGDTVRKGTPILSISNDAQRLSMENARLTANYYDYSANQSKLDEAREAIDLAADKLANDSLLYYRQLSLWKQEVGTKVELEQRQLAFASSKNAYQSALVRYRDLKRQLDFNSEQSKKNLRISEQLASDYTLRSDIDGIVYDISKSKGEIVSPQTSVAIIGDASRFILEMQVDEYDILKIRKGLKVMVTLDSYKGQVFEAQVTRINPLMNDRTKTFLVEAVFTRPPERLYPNISFEANILLHTKDKALLIPRTYLVNDSYVIKKGGERVRVTTGLMDYRKVEILSGIGPNDELQLPEE